MAEPIAKKRRGRPAARSVLIRLPMPPSVNELWFNVRGRGRVKTDAYRAWLNEAGWTIRAEHIEKISGRVAISVRAALPTTRACDLDNILKPILDALVSFAVISDDCEVVRLTAGWALDVAKGTVAVHVKQFPDLQTCHLISRAHAIAREKRAAELSERGLFDDGRQPMQPSGGRNERAHTSGAGRGLRSY